MAGVSNPGVEHDAKTRGIILHIVEQIKSQGVFDRFRRDCLEELDSKEPYRQLKQRVESHVATFLSKQTFSSNLPKNQLRTSLRANINQSEVLSKGVDRLLEQVLVEKSSSFYKEIENLVEEHLISTGHYTRYERDKSQRSDAQPKSELTKLSDKEVEDIIKEETNKLLEASSDERSQESDKGSYADTPPPGTSGEAIEVETLIDVINDKKCAQPSQLVNRNVEASVNPTPDLSAGKSSVEMPASEESASKDETEVDRQTDGSMVSKSQNLDDVSLKDGSKGQETNALLSELKNPTSANDAKAAGEISQKPVTITESSTASASATRESRPKVVDIQDDLSTSNQNTSASRGKVTAAIPEITSADNFEPAAEIHHRTSVTEQTDISKGGAVNVDSSAVRIGSERDESKAGIKKATVAMELVKNLTNEIKQQKNSKVGADNPEIVKPKAEKVKPEVPKSREAKPEIVKSEIGKPEVSKSKAEKTRKAEVDIPKVVKPEIGKPKANMAPSKPAVGKTRIIKPEVRQVELFSPDVISKVKVGKTRKPEEKVKTKTKTDKQRSKKSTKPKTKEAISMPKLFSTDEETDEDLGIPSAKTSANKPKQSKTEFSEADNADLSDSDITVSSVHTSDLSSLEDSMSDMEYEDYQELVLKKSKGDEPGATTGKKSDESGASESSKSGGESGAGGTETVDKKISKDTDGESGNASNTKTDTKEKSKELDESRATNPKINCESSEGVIEKNASKENKPDHSDISSDEERNKINDELDSAQKTESPPSSRGEEPTSSEQSNSDPALFKPIEPAGPQVFPEPAPSRRGGPAFTQATDDASDAGNETSMEHSDAGNIILGKRRHSRRASTSQESESSNDTITTTEEQREPQAQRRSARVASKDKTRSTDEKDDHGRGDAQKSEEAEGDSARKVRRTRYSQEKTHEVRSARPKEETRNEKAEKRTSRLASDSTDSEVKPAKRSKRTVKPTRCYSPSENS